MAKATMSDDEILRAWQEAHRLGGFLIAMPHCRCVIETHTVPQRRQTTARPPADAFEARTSAPYAASLHTDLPAATFAAMRRL